MGKGQVTFEAMLAVLIMLLAFAVVAAQANMRSEQIVTLESSWQQRSECLLLASAISMADNSSDNSELNVELSYPAEIRNTTIAFENYFCNFLGGNDGSADANLTSGTVRIRKEGGNLNVQNI